jgi:hypothetical protein
MSLCERVYFHQNVTYLSESQDQAKHYKCSLICICGLQSNEQNLFCSALCFRKNKHVPNVLYS